MDLEKFKQRIVTRFNKEYDTNYSSFEEALNNDEDATELFSFSGINTEIDWRKKLEKHYKVKINSYEDIAVLSSENATVSVEKDDENELVLKYSNVSGDWQLPIDFKVTINQKGRKTIDLGEFKNDFREYTNYINEIELIAEYLGFNKENLTGTELVDILNKYFNSLLIITSTSAERGELITDYETFLNERPENSWEDIYDLEEFSALPKEVGKPLFDRVVEKVLEYPFD